jgi:alanyl-tRNA synthetase
MIKEALPVKRIETTLDEAIRMGSQAVFEQKYGEKVTVYSIGDFSNELCSGPHVENTGELGRFKIIKEEGISAGVRRIRAVLE